MKRRTFLKIGTGAAMGGALAACGGGGDRVPPVATQPQRLKAVVGWNQAALQAIRTTRPGPPMAARSLAVLHTSMYNAWAAYDPLALPVAPGAAGRRPAAEHSAANRAEAMSHAAYTALLDQFPAQQPAFATYLASLGYAPETVPDPSTPRGLGVAVARAMLEYCHHDGSNQLGELTPGGIAYADYTGYTPKNVPMRVTEPTAASAIAAPGNWQPLSYTDASGVLKTPGYLAACWALVRPFALSSANQFRPGPPAAAGTPEYAAQAGHVIELQATLTEQQKVIAEYWADGPNSELPPGHWCLFAQQVSERDRHTDEDDVKLFLALSNALADAAIAAWDAKRTYDSARPITAIRYLMNGKVITGLGPMGPADGLRQIAGEAWVPYQPSTFPTPPFPEYVSGHSTFSAAAAEVLQRFTGSDAWDASYTKAAGSMLLEPGLPSRDVILSWASFSDAAAEAGLSRIYGGIHFDAANSAGQALGRKVGALVFERAQRYWQGVG